MLWPRQTSNQNNHCSSELAENSPRPSLDPGIDSLLQKLLHDLRTTLTPKYEALWNALLSQASRSLPPGTLETYIQTLSLFLKHLLLPEPSNIALTWHKLATTIKRCRPDVQRMLAEVWATVLRRLKAEARVEMTMLLVEAVDALPDAIAWMCISAFQTTSTTLHTSTIPLLSLLWDTSLRVDNDEAMFTLMRRVLSATMHYCSPESFRPIAELVVARIQTLCDTIVEDEHIHRTLQMVLVVTALRKGKKAESMFPGEQYSATLL
jgi:U3 small nucleolar RNA-associated protein 20